MQILDHVLFTFIRWDGTQLLSIHNEIVPDQNEGITKTLIEHISNNRVTKLKKWRKNYNSETEQVTMVGVTLVSLGRIAYGED